jgi:threonine synthase
MDILISSNLERLLYLIAGEDSDKTKALMDELKSTGKYTITEDMKVRLADFAAGFASEEATDVSIKSVYDKTGYVMDTHTAVADHVCKEYMKKTGDIKKCVIASTASPYKFVKSVMTAIDAENAKEDEFTLLPKLNEASGVEMPQAIKDILEANVLHTIECDIDKMQKTVEEILGL